MDLDIAIMRRERAQAYAWGRRDEKLHPTAFVHSADFVNAMGEGGAGSYAATYQQMAEHAPDELTVHRDTKCGLAMRQVRIHGKDYVVVAGEVLSPSDADQVARALQTLALKSAAHNSRGAA